MSELWELIKSMWDEFELAVHRWVLRQHLPEPIDGEPYCLAMVHRHPEVWPCSEFLRVDRAIDDVLARRSPRS